MITIIYLALIIFMIYGRVTKRPACNSRGMFYLKVLFNNLLLSFNSLNNLKMAILFGALSYNIASLLSDIKPGNFQLLLKL